MTERTKVSAEDILVTKAFVTPIISLDWPRANAANDDLLATILARESRDIGVTHSNDGGWQSRDDCAEWCGPHGRDLIEYGSNLANAVSAIYDPHRGLLEPNLAWVCNSWANVNRSGHANSPHTHPGAFWSAVYYVDADGMNDAPDRGGELEFFDPRGAMPNMLAPNLKMRVEGCLCAGLSHLVTPRTGMLVMFPSWLMHSVRRYRGDRPRVSIALNFALPGYATPGTQATG